MRWRLTVPSELYRRALARAGDDRSLVAAALRWLEDFANGATESQRHGAAGGSKAAARMTPEARIARARKASAASLAKRGKDLPYEAPIDAGRVLVPYVLPDGRVVDVDASAAKGWAVISFQLLSGEIVEARRLDRIEPPASGGSRR
jgi:hypothetical protein